jgi:hypothetical protein
MREGDVSSLKRKEAGRRKKKRTKKKRKLEPYV